MSQFAQNFPCTESPTSWKTPRSPANPTVGTLIKVEIKETLSIVASSLEGPDPTFLLIHGRQDLPKLSQSGYRSVLTALHTKGYDIPLGMEKKAFRTQAPNSVHMFPSPRRLKKIGHQEMEMLDGWSHSQPRANFPDFYIFGCDGNIPPSFQIHMAQGQRHGELVNMAFSMIKRAQS